MVRGAPTPITYACSRCAIRTDEPQYIGSLPLCFTCFDEVSWLKEVRRVPPKYSREDILRKFVE